MRLIRLFFISVYLLINTVSYADSVMPIFSNEWFLSRPGSGDVSWYETQCGSPSFQYQYLNSSPEALNHDNNVINEDSFSSFTNKPDARFWGEVYAPLTHPHFTQKRTAFPIPISTGNPLNQLNQFSKDTCTTDVCYQNQIQTILASSQSDAEALHQAIQGYVQATNNPATSIQYLYSEAMLYQNDPDRYDVLMQELQQQAPIDLLKNLLEKLVQDYKPSNNQALYTMARALDLTDHPETQALGQDSIKAI